MGKCHPAWQEIRRKFHQISQIEWLNPCQLTGEQFSKTWNEDILEILKLRPTACFPISCFTSTYIDITEPWDFEGPIKDPKRIISWMELHACMVGSQIIRRKQTLTQESFNATGCFWGIDLKQPNHLRVDRFH